MPVPLDEATAEPVDEQPAGHLPPEPEPDQQPAGAGPTEPGDLAAQVAALTRRLDTMAESFDASVRHAVAEEVQRVAGDLQHTVTALGRILVRDLGKLSQILNEHRDKIVAQLREGPVATAPGGPSGPTERGARAPAGATPAVGPVVAVDEGGTAEAPTDGVDLAESSDQSPASGRQWRGRRRKA